MGGRAGGMLSFALERISILNFTDTVRVHRYFGQLLQGLRLRSLSEASLGLVPFRPGIAFQAPLHPRERRGVWLQARRFYWYFC